MPRENVFQAKLIENLTDLFPDGFILKLDPNYIQGFPDRLIINGNRWAAFETKRSFDAPHQPNQDYYVNLLNSMSYASFIYPENEKRVIRELQQALRITRAARLFRSI